MASKSLNNLLDIWKHSKPKNKLAFSLISILSVVSGILETLVILSFVPFITNITSSSEKTEYIKIPISNSIIENEINIKLYLILFIVLVTISALLRLLFIYSASINAADLGSSLSTDCYKSIILRPYIDQISKDSSKSIEFITSNVTRAIQVIISVQVLISASFLTLSIIYVLIQASWKSTLIIVISIFTCYYILFSISKGGLYENGKIVQNYSVKIIAIIKESIDSIRDIILSNLFKEYIQRFKKVDVELKRRQAMASFIAQYPRFIIEAIIFILMSYVAYFLSQSESQKDLLSLLALVALGFIRLIPAIQQIYTNLSNIKTYSYSLELINNCLNEKAERNIFVTNSKKIQSLDHSLPIISLQNVSFKYPLGKTNAITNLSLIIRSGENAAIIGPSGSGKSTLQDILLGLLPPDKGKALYHGNDLKNQSVRNQYHRTITHVPQNPIIINATIAENITFTSDNFQKSKFENCIESVLLTEFVKANGINYICGEDGCNLSGGQKQRLAIARALYAEKDILFLDECTSALDQSTEDSVLDNILEQYKNKTIISITHKVRTLERYDKVIDLTKSR